MERKKKPIISFLVTEWSLFVKSRVPFTKECFLLSLVEIGPVVLEKNIFKISSVWCIFCYFVIISPWKREWPFLWTNLDAPLPKDAFCQVWLKLAQWFLRRRFLNFISVFSLFCNNLPLEKGVALYLNLKSPSTRHALCQVWLKLAQWFLKLWKVYRRTGDQKSSLELSAQVS